MPDEKTNDGGAKLSIRSVLTPNPILALFVGSILLLLVAIFVFGARGKYSDVDTADLLRTIAIGALAAAITGIVDRTFFIKNINSEIRSCLRENDDLSAAISQLGIYTAHKKFDFRKIFDEAKAGETIHWLDTYCPVQNDFLDGIRAAVARRVKVQMLIIHPKSKTAAYRNIELTGTPEAGDAFNYSLRSFIEKMKLLSDAHPETFLVRFYSDLPCVPMYLICSDHGSMRKGYFSLFLDRASAHCTHLELRGGEWLHSMGAYFEAKWKRWEAATLQSVLPTLNE